MNIAKNMTKKRDFDLRLYYPGYIGCNGIFFSFPLRDAHFLYYSLQNRLIWEMGVIYVFMPPSRPCCYVYAYFDDYVLCFRNWIWAVFAFCWHLINIEADLQMIQINIEIYPFIISIPIHVKQTEVKNQIIRILQIHMAHPSSTSPF